MTVYFFATMLFDIIYTVAKYVTFGNEGTFIQTAPLQEVGVLLK